MFARELPSSAARLLAVYDLNHAEVRFMQTATLTIITGGAVANMVKDDFNPASIIFFAPHDAYPSVIRFFDLATPYDVSPAEWLHREDGAIHSTCLYGPPLSRFVYLLRAETDSAMDCVPYAKLSHLMLALTHYGLWLAYPEAVGTGATYPNRDSLDFADTSTIYGLKAVLVEAVHNVRIKFNFAGRHICGVHYECPATHRTTKDGGCLNIFFPGQPMGAPSENKHVYPIDSAMQWSLGGRNCTTGAAGQLNVRQRQDGCEYQSKSNYLVTYILHR
jgi:hypothetical protein